MTKLTGLTQIGGHSVTGGEQEQSVLHQLYIESYPGEGLAKNSQDREKIYSLVMIRFKDDNHQTKF